MKRLNKLTVFTFLVLFLAVNTMLCIKTYAQVIKVEICDARQSGTCDLPDGTPIQSGKWIGGDEGDAQQ